MSGGTYPWADRQSGTNPGKPSCGKTVAKITKTAQNSRVPASFCYSYHNKNIIIPKIYHFFLFAKISIPPLPCQGKILQFATNNFSNIRQNKYFLLIVPITHAILTIKLTIFILDYSTNLIRFCVLTGKTQGDGRKAAYRNEGLAKEKQ